MEGKFTISLHLGKIITTTKVPIIMETLAPCTTMVLLE
jgi:hypothetical protein